MKETRIKPVTGFESDEVENRIYFHMSVFIHIHKEKWILCLHTTEAKD